MSKSETDEQAELDQFKTALDLREESSVEKKTKPNWQPLDDNETETGTHVKCPRCGNEVLADFARVFGNNDDELENGCPDCATYREIAGLDRVGTGVGRGDGW